MARKAKTIIHVNMHVIKANLKTGARDPVITVRNRGKTTHAHEVLIYGQDGKLAAKVVYSPDKPLSCSARVWIETTNEVRPVGVKPWHGVPYPEQLLTSAQMCEAAGQTFEITNGGPVFKAQETNIEPVFENTLMPMHPAT